MVLVLILGGGLGWIAYRARTQRLAVEAIETAGGKVYYEWEWDRTTHFPRVATSPSSWPPKWLADAVGPDYLGEVAAVRAGDAKEIDDATLKVMGRLDQLDFLNLSGCERVTDAGLAHLRGLKRLKSISLEVTRIHGDGFAGWENPGSLEELFARDTPVTDTGLARVAIFKSLKLLDLDGARLTDNGLANLSGLTNLEWLQVKGGPITGRGLVPLANLRRLKLLSLPNTQVESLAPLGELTEVAMLNIGGTKVDDKGLAAIAGWSKLDDLTLFKCPVGDAGMEHVKGLKRMISLTLTGTKVTDEGLSRLATLNEMTQLTLRRTSIGDAGLEQIAKMKKVINIDLADTDVSDDCLESLGGMSVLRNLDLSRTRVTQAGVARLKSRFPKLQVQLKSRFSID